MRDRPAAPPPRTASAEWTRRLRVRFTSTRGEPCARRPRRPFEPVWTRYAGRVPVYSQNAPGITTSNFTFAKPAPRIAATIVSGGTHFSTVSQ